MVCPKCGCAELEIPCDDDYNSYWVITKGYGLGLLLVQLLKVLFKKHYGDICICTRCGSRWYTERIATVLQNRKVMERYLGKDYALKVILTPDGRKLCLEEDVLSICWPKGKRLEVPYDELAAVGYHGNVGPLNGWLTVRTRARAKRPLPEDFKQAKKDRQTVLCCFGSENTYYQIYLALQAIVEENRKAGLL